MGRAASLAIAALVAHTGGASVKPLSAVEFRDREPRWWLEMGVGYGRSLSAAGDSVEASAHLPAFACVVQLALSPRLALVGELDVPVMLSPDGWFGAGIGLALVLPLSTPRMVLTTEVTREPRRFRSRFELVVRGTGGWGAVFNDLSEGYIHTSDESFEGAGLYARGVAGVRWRLDSDRGWLKSLGVGLYPAVTALDTDYSTPDDARDGRRVNVSVSILTGLAF
jgi:hypothetical protein